MQAMFRKKEIQSCPRLAFPLSCNVSQAYSISPANLEHILSLHLLGHAQRKLGMDLAPPLSRRPGGQPGPKKKGPSWRRKRNGPVSVKSERPFQSDTSCQPPDTLPPDIQKSQLPGWKRMASLLVGPRRKAFLQGKKEGLE